MRKKSAACIALALCVAAAGCGCSAGEEENVFTGETPERPAWQANLDAVDPAEENASLEFMKILPKAIDSLPEKYSEALRLRNEEDLSYEEISKRMGISVGTVKSRLSRAREYLRVEMEKLK